ncbi:hypothetical protein AVEN_92225-1 [Araneus ventricosus]|uniref:Uncharacterized protein n=1 Tax=Araneus ventricosus TaxID=182803 RepID=A0A4Y2AKB7_ARAVE|nr:hypothetical protein AVEN_92225-1 [Araneus ventricosus]
MRKEQYEESMSIEEDIPVAATLTYLEIYQAVCKQEQAIKVDDSEGDECVEENNPLTNAEMKQALDISKRTMFCSIVQKILKTIQVRRIYRVPTKVPYHSFNYRMAAGLFIRVVW